MPREMRGLREIVIPHRLIRAHHQTGEAFSRTDGHADGCGSHRPTLRGVAPPNVLTEEELSIGVPSPSRSELKLEPGGEDAEQLRDDLFRRPRCSSQKGQEI